MHVVYSVVVHTYIYGNLLILLRLLPQLPEQHLKITCDDHKYSYTIIFTYLPQNVTSMPKNEKLIHMHNPLARKNQIRCYSRKLIVFGKASIIARRHYNLIV